MNLFGSPELGRSPADASAARSQGLPPVLAALQERLRPIVRKLPVQPPSFAAALLLDRLLLPRLGATQREELGRRTVEVEVVDFGLRVRLQLQARGFVVAPSSEPPVLTVRATAAALWRLVRGVDDADRLFFERALMMEGDTEFGLVLKNTLDAIGPLWGPSAGSSPR
jgi:predicted lipid carrier protein YhbT